MSWQPPIAAPDSVAGCPSFCQVFFCHPPFPSVSARSCATRHPARAPLYRQ